MVGVRCRGAPLTHTHANSRASTHTQTHTQAQLYELLWLGIYAARRRASRFGNVVRLFFGYIGGTLDAGNPRDLHQGRDDGGCFAGLTHNAPEKKPTESDIYLYIHTESHKRIIIQIIVLFTRAFRTQMEDARYICTYRFGRNARLSGDAQCEFASLCSRGDGGDGGQNYVWKCARRLYALGLARRAQLTEHARCAVCATWLGIRLHLNRGGASGTAATTVRYVARSQRGRFW